jgi:hypothetical protein
MVPLLVLGVLLLAAWAYAIWERDRHTAFMRDWIHLPLLAAITVLLMALGAAIRG